MSDARLERIRAALLDVPDFPKPGIVFKDITPLLADASVFETTIDLLAEAIAPHEPDVVVGIESRGFLFGPALALRLGKGFVPVRKPGKLPRATHRVEYALEYGTDALEMHVDALPSGARVVVVDDVLATGGTARATGELVRRAGGSVVGYAFLIELGFLGGAGKLAPASVTGLVRLD